MCVIDMYNIFLKYLNNIKSCFFASYVTLAYFTCMNEYKPKQPSKI